MNPAARRLDADRHGGVELWLIDLDGYAGSEDLSCCTPSERERALRMRNDARARRFLAGRHALRALLAQTVAKSPHELTFRTSRWGKPALAGGLRLQFSMSRSGALALIGLSPRLPIGVDLEVLRPLPDERAVIRTQLTASERRCLLIAGESRTRRLLTAWTRKEAALKALGTGLLLSAADARVGVTEKPRVAQVRAEAHVCRASVRSITTGIPAVAAYALTSTACARRAQAALDRW